MKRRQSRTPPKSDESAGAQVEADAQQRSFVSFAAAARPVPVSRWGDRLMVFGDADASASFRLPAGGSILALDGELLGTTESAARSVFAAIDAVFAWEPGRDVLAVSVGGREDIAVLMKVRGELVDMDGQLAARSAMFMQQPHGWLARAERVLFPETFVLTGGRRHPLRPPKPDGVVYARFIPWLEKTLTFRTVDLDGDLATFHRWMNDPRVAHFWTEAGDLDAHRLYLEALIADPHMVPLIAEVDGFAFAYFEIYWAKENRLAPFYDVDDYDRGWHVAVGEDACRGAAYVSAWLPSLVHFMFLDDWRTRRIVGEPASAHRQQIRNLERSGFAQIKTFDFPHKRATLVSLLRERFFAERLWRPSAPGTDAAAPEPVSAASA